MAKTDAIISARDRIAVALDVPGSREALDLADRLGDACSWLKVGMELYYASGNSLIAELRSRGFRVFLDLKLHDIPNTVAGAVRSVSQTGAELLTVHACGGPAMLEAAAKAAETPGAPRLLAVTVLTSMDAHELNAAGVPGLPGPQVVRLATLAKDSGIDGMVCSPEEVSAVREATGPDSILVVPGIRPKGYPTDDQRRIATAGETISRGASILVVGRPITRAADPAAAARAIVDEIASAELA
ncbi:MAG: orotidine-5'-phosphate decarboxylase [Edaphobacter sp.]|uniref:orotidine-5'-phosphate decarboxylase n=1 Tax=Edaphobacter sp. TaxID=1934404 RepID=UPI00238A789C|nr:orotidine-5'-phosphate decarboxylase [Edaphobacter sp.]MDE1175362.1 orotidine-5'-phosphate decarboxylase [Edaphobacter sp.]